MSPYYVRGKKKIKKFIELNPMAEKNMSTSKTDRDGWLLERMDISIRKFLHLFKWKVNFLWWNSVGELSLWLWVDVLILFSFFFV